MQCLVGNSRYAIKRTSCSHSQSKDELMNTIIAIFSLGCIVIGMNLSKLCHISTYMWHVCGYLT